MDSRRYNRVWRAFDIKRNHNVAIKSVPKHDIKQTTATATTIPIEKEILIQRNLSHPNIVKLYEVLEDTNHVYLVQDYCAGGELFERIEPDIGFPTTVCHFYFIQLLRALQYLHQRGIAHRDIKPENLLLDGQGNLRLADFGLATLFKKANIRRRLQTRCGTPLYMAPEVIAGSYEGDEVDLWSAALVLFVMLRGGHPWEEASAKCIHYKKFVIMKEHDYPPWGSIDPSCRDLLERMLVVNPRDRLKLEDVLSHPWMIRVNPLFDANFMCNDDHALVALVNSSIDKDVSRSSAFSALTQPETISIISSQAMLNRSRSKFIGFSQPSNLITNTPLQIDNNAGAFSTPLTRFFSTKAICVLFVQIKRILDGFLITWKEHTLSNQVSFTTVDKRRNPLTGNILIVNVKDEFSMIIFIKGRGDILEFKKLFKMVYDRITGE